MKVIYPIYFEMKILSETNRIGDTISQLEKRKVLASIKSIRQSEFYQAQALGLKPEIVFEIRKIEYLNEESLIYNGKIYRIMRAYEKSNGMVELVCTGDVNNGSS